MRSVLPDTPAQLKPPPASGNLDGGALAVTPAGSNGEYGLPPELVRTVERGSGCRVWDTNGREYLDYTMAWGSVLTGHAHPRVVEAITEAARCGINYAAVNRRSVALAERLIAQCPCVERVRFVASGTEATFMCLRIARAATGRRKVLKFDGAYHGQHPVGVASMVRSGQTTLPQSDPSGTGAPWVGDDLLVAPFNDLAGTERILRAHAADLAGVIVEPIHRCLVPQPGFLEGLRALTRELKIVLIFDEVVTGFRLAPGGAQEYYGVVPDLAAYGKALASGLPLGAYGGRAELMECVSELRLGDEHYAWSASTTGGNPVSCAAALATLEVLQQPGVYDQLHELGRRFRSLMRRALEDTGVAGTILGDGPLAQLAFSDQPVLDQTSWLQSDRARGRAVMIELFKHGIFLNPMSTKLYVSLAHDEPALQVFTQRLVTALNQTNSEVSD
jgi:glutamate-1-semialdehyde 2,1-aminomutase